MGEVSHVLNEMKRLVENGGIFFKIEERGFNLIPEVIDILVE